jgi:hypothetical protein
MTLLSLLKILLVIGIIFSKKKGIKVLLFFIFVMSFLIIVPYLSHSFIYLKLNINP